MSTQRRHWTWYTDTIGNLIKLYRAAAHLATDTAREQPNEDAEICKYARRVATEARRRLLPLCTEAARECEWDARDLETADRNTLIVFLSEANQPTQEKGATL